MLFVPCVTHLSQHDHESPKPRLAQIGIDIARDLDALADVVDENLRHELRNKEEAREKQRTDRTDKKYIECC